MCGFRVVDGAEGFGDFVFRRPHGAAACQQGVFHACFIAVVHRDVVVAARFEFEQVIIAQPAGQGAALAPQPPFSKITAMAICGFSMGAKAMNQAWSRCCSASAAAL